MMPSKLCVGIYWIEEDDKIIIDEEEMTREFEIKLKELKELVK